MRKIKKRIVAAVSGLVLLFGLVVQIYGVDISQFSFDVSAQLDGDILNITVDAAAPTPEGTGSFYCYFRSGDIEIKDPIGASTLGVDDIADGSVFSYGDTTMMVWTSLHEGSTARYSLKYDVSGMSISEGSTLEMIGAGSKLGMEEGTCIAWDSDILTKTGTLASCTISEKSGSTSTSTVLPTSSITDTTNGAATVTGTVDNGTATLNVTSEKACVVAYTEDNGTTYKRLTATDNAAGGHDFVVPETYSEEMKFVVAVKGDANGDGNVNTADSMTIARSCLSNSHSAYVERSALNDCLYDVNGDNQVNTADSMLIARACLSTTHAAYQALTW